MSSQFNVSMTYAFHDSTSKNFVLEDVPVDNLGQVKAKVKAINANASGEYNPFRNLFVSNAGASFAEISVARIIQVEEEVLYNA